MGRRRKLNYDEGTCFVFPLGNGGFARGVVARMNGKGSVFGYFFGPRLASLSDANMDGLEPKKAIWLTRFGDLGFLENAWTVLGKLPHWNREEWPMPPLIRVDELENRAWLAFYDDKTFSCLRDNEVDPSLAKLHPEDGSSGYVAVEVWMSKLLSNKTH